MKKFLGIILIISLMVTSLFVTVWAADTPSDDAPAPAPAADVVLRISAEKPGKKYPVVIADHTNFADGWNAARELAISDQMRNYDRVVVDLYANWTATDGEFSNDGKGFYWDAIYFPYDVKVTLNMNGHTIDRALEDSEENGEVMCVDDGADVIINNGTITGGHSDNGAGGIHINDKATVTLNNVHIVGNAANEDDGGGIAVYDGATLIMNGGSFVNNSVDGLFIQFYSEFYGGAVYVEHSTAIFNDVEFKNNNLTQHANFGAAIYADDSKITINRCTFDGNGVENQDIDIAPAYSVIHGDDTSIKVIESTFTNNGSEIRVPDGIGYSGLFILEDSTLIIEKSEFRNNYAHCIINDADESLICVTDTNFSDNNSSVIRGDSDTSEKSFFKGCTFNNNTNASTGYASFCLDKNLLTFENCSMGNSTFSKNINVKFVNSDVKNGVGSIFGDGSLTMIVSITALIVSVAAIGVSITTNKKISSSKASVEDDE